MECLELGWLKHARLPFLRPGGTCAKWYSSGLRALCPVCVPLSQGGWTGDLLLGSGGVAEATLSRSMAAPQWLHRQEAGTAGLVKLGAAVSLPAMGAPLPTPKVPNAERGAPAVVT